MKVYNRSLGGDSEMLIHKSGVYRNIHEKRYEYWVVKSEELKVMASWISWDLPQDSIDKWMNEVTDIES